MSEAPVLRILLNLTPIPLYLDLYLCYFSISFDNNKVANVTAPQNIVCHES